MEAGGSVGAGGGADQAGRRAHVALLEPRLQRGGHHLQEAEQLGPPRLLLCVGRRLLLRLGRRFGRRFRRRLGRRFGLALGITLALAASCRSFPLLLLSVAPPPL